MLFDDIITEFVTRLQEEKTGQTYETYRKKIYVFQDYVETKFSPNCEALRSVLEGMKASDILESVDHYVKTCNVQYKSTTDSFFVVIGVFFKYLRDTYSWNNTCFNNSKKAEDLRKNYEEHATNTLHLNAKEQILPIDDRQFQSLINRCNEKIDSPTFEEIVSGRYTGVYTKYISSLVSKFVSLYGCKNQVIERLPLSAYNSELNQISINQYRVHLPDQLALQMKRYVGGVRQHIISQTPSEYLFIDIDNGKPLDNNKKFDVLKGILGNTQGTALMKYAIIQMIKGGAPAHLIMEFTGCSTVIYNHCQELYDEEFGIFRPLEKSKLIDTTLRGTNTFDML